MYSCDSSTMASLIIVQVLIFCPWVLVLGCLFKKGNSGVESMSPGHSMINLPWFAFTSYHHLPVLKFQLFPFIQVSNFHLFFLHMLILSLQCKPASSSPQTLTAPPPTPCLYFLVETHPYTSQIFSYIIFLPPQPISLPYPLLPCHKQFQWWFWKILSIKLSFLLIVNYCEHKKTYF